MVKFMLYTFYHNLKKKNKAKGRHEDGLLWSSEQGPQSGLGRSSRAGQAGSPRGGQVPPAWRAWTTRGSCQVARDKTGTSATKSQRPK